MRVISGKAKGRRLIAAKGGAVRPTADRIKESLFDILPRDFSDMEILELFAGTGNVSIEALSRGAESALLVDASEHSARIIRENLRRVEFAHEYGSCPRAERSTPSPDRVTSLILFFSIHPTIRSSSDDRSSSLHQSIRLTQAPS